MWNDNEQKNKQYDYTIIKNDLILHSDDVINLFLLPKIANFGYLS